MYPGADRSPPVFKAAAEMPPALARDTVVLPATLAGTLTDGEAVLLRLKPSLWFLFFSRLDAAIGIIIVCSLGLLLSWLEIISVREGAVFAYAIIALAALLGWNCLDWLTREYILTDRRVIRVSGIFRRTMFDIRLDRVQSLVLHQSIRERLCGCGTLVFSSSADAPSGQFPWFFLSRPERIASRVREAIDRASGGGA